MTTTVVPVFEVGDEIQSHPTSLDVTIQGDMWRGVVLREKPQRGAPNGVAYVTQGFWVSNPTKITTRILWGNKIVKATG